MTEQAQKTSVGKKMADAIKSAANSIERTFQGRRPKTEQHIALFGESGSGKTTLLTVFYGYQQDTKFQKEAGYRLLADDLTQGQNLLSSFWNLSSLPATRLQSRKYSFQIRLDGVTKVKETAHLVWHDYPGEWWTETKTDGEQQDKEKTFLALMSSDVALFLVDGAKLKESGDKYLKCLFCNFRDELCRLKDYPALKRKFPLKHFPRIWLICLSKSDLLPDLTAEEFKKRVLSVANDELQAVKREIQEIIEVPELFTLGEDYMKRTNRQRTLKSEKAWI
jgi:GTPase SAR1 family protein